MKRGALVLCGGHSRRMGRDKGALPFGGETLLQRTVRRVTPAVDDVVVVARPGQPLPPLPDDVRVARDRIEDQGPLVGLLTGLDETRADAVFLTGCDTPFLNRHVVDLLFERLGSNAVAVAEEGGFLHPLCAVYRRDVAAHVERMVREGSLRPVSLYDLVPTVRVVEAELQGVDPDLAMLRTCNTPEAYAEALALALDEGGSA